MYYYPYILNIYVRSFKYYCAILLLVFFFSPNSCLQHRTELLLYPVSIFIVLLSFATWLYFIARWFFKWQRRNAALSRTTVYKLFDSPVTQWCPFFGISDRFIYVLDERCCCEGKKFVCPFYRSSRWIFFLEKFSNQQLNNLMVGHLFIFVVQMKTACECSYVSTAVSTIRRVKFQTTGQT